MARTTATRSSTTAAAAGTERAKPKPPKQVQKSGQKVFDGAATTSSHASDACSPLDTKEQAEQERVALKKEEAILGIENALKKCQCSLCKQHVELHRVRPMNQPEKKHAHASRKTTFKTKVKPKKVTSAKKRTTGRHKHKASDDETDDDVDAESGEEDVDFDTGYVESIKDRDAAKETILILETISETAGIKAGFIELEEEAAAKSNKKLPAVDFSTNKACGHVFCVDCRSKQGRLFKDTGKKINLACPVTTIGRPCGAPLNRLEIQNPKADKNVREVQLYKQMKQTLVALRRLDARRPDCMDQICQLLDYRQQQQLLPVANGSATPSEQTATPVSSASSPVKHPRRDTKLSAASSAANNNGIIKKSWKTSRNPLKQILYKLRATFFPKLNKFAVTNDAVDHAPVEERDNRSRVAAADSHVPAEDTNEVDSIDELIRSRSGRSKSASKQKVQPPSAKKIKLTDQSFKEAGAAEPDDAKQANDDTLQSARLRRSGRRRTAVVSLINEQKKQKRKIVTPSKVYRQTKKDADSSPSSNDSDVSDADITVYDAIPTDDSEQTEVDADDVENDADAAGGKLHADLSNSPDSVLCLKIKRGPSKRAAAPQRRRRGQHGPILSSTRKDVRESSSSRHGSLQRRSLTKYKFCVSKNRGKKPASSERGKTNIRRRRAVSRRVAANETKIEVGKELSGDNAPQLHFGFNQLAVDVADIKPKGSNRKISDQYSGGNVLADIDDALLQSLNRGLNALNVDSSTVVDAEDANDVMMKSALEKDVGQSEADGFEPVQQVQKQQSTAVVASALPGLPDDGNEVDSAAAEAHVRARAVQQGRIERKLLKKVVKPVLPPAHADDVDPVAPERQPASLALPERPSRRVTVSSQNPSAPLSQPSSTGPSATILSVNDCTAVSLRTIISQSSQGISDQTPSMVEGALVAEKERSNNNNNVEDDLLDKLTAADDGPLQQQQERQDVGSQISDAVDVLSLIERKSQIEFCRGTRGEIVPTCADTDVAPTAAKPPPPPAIVRTSLARSAKLPTASSRGGINHQTLELHSTPIADPSHGGGGGRQAAALMFDISPIQHISPVASSAPAHTKNDGAGNVQNGAAFCFSSAAVRQVPGVTGLHAKRRPSQFGLPAADIVDDGAAATSDGSNQQPTSSTGGWLPQRQNLQFLDDDDFSGGDNQNRNIPRRSVERRAAAAARSVADKQQPQQSNNMARKVMTQQAYSAAAVAAAAAAFVLPPKPPVNFDFGGLGKHEQNPTRPPRAIDLDDLVAFGADDALTEAYRAKQRRLVSGGGRRNTRDFVLCSTGIATSQQLAAIKKFVRDILHAKYDKHFSRSTTHLIVMCDEKGECPRTLKYLQCLAQQKYCVSYEWVQRALAAAAAQAGKNNADEADWLDEFQFLSRGDNSTQHELPSDAPRRAVASDTKPLSRVLAYFDVHAKDDEGTDADWDREIVTGITRRNYVELLDDMGAQVCFDYKKFSLAVSGAGGPSSSGSNALQRFDYKIWIVETYSEKDLTLCKLLGTTAHYVDISWLLECISTFSMLPFGAFMPMPSTAHDEAFDIEDGEDEEHRRAAVAVNGGGGARR